MIPTRIVPQKAIKEDFRSFVLGNDSFSESSELSMPIWIVSFVFLLLDHVVFESVILELVVLGSVVLESVVLESVVLGSVVLGSVVLGSVVLGSVVLGSVVLGSVVLGSGSFFVLVITKEFSLLVTVLSKSVGTLVSCIL